MGLADEQLVAEAREGSQTAFRELVHRYERPVFNLVIRIVRDRELAEDLSQDAFVKAFSRLETYRSEQGKFSNWLFKIAHNTSLDHLRRGALTTVSLEPHDPSEGGGIQATIADPDQPSPLDAAVAGDLAAALETGLSRLRPEYREVLVLRGQEGLAYEEIAEITGLPLGTVKTYIHRGRKQLAALLIDAGWGPATDPFGG